MIYIYTWSKQVFYPSWNMICEIVIHVFASVQFTFNPNAQEFVAIKMQQIRHYKENNNIN